MQARDRTIREWFDRIRSGQLRLPRFQRGEAWEADNVESLLDSVLRGLPAGAALVLEIGRDEPFITRPLPGAPAPKEHCTEHLLDGQQRLTALWKSLQDLYEEQLYFVRLAESATDEEGGAQSRIYRQNRWTHRDGRRFPLWADSPVEVYSRGLIPASLLQPEDVSSKRLLWLRSALSNDLEAILEVDGQIRALQERVKLFNIPMLSLDVSTAPITALDVFVKMNTSAVPLTTYDILVAQFEAKTGKSMASLMLDLRKKVPALASYTTPEELVLQIAALRADKPPTQASVRGADFDLTKIDESWDEIVAGVRWSVQMLEAERIFDAARLPTSIVLPVVAALYPYLPTRLDAAGNARSLVRSYLWRAFATARYEAASAGRALQDFRGMRSALHDARNRSEAPIFSETDYPFPSLEQIVQAGWPKRKDTLARAILAVSLRAGACDIADASPVSRDHLQGREYHHLFPNSLLTGEGGLSDRESNRALNCALITMSTNRNVAAKEPLAYLSERVSRAGLGEEAIRQRLSTHRVPYESLRAGGYAAIDDAKGRATKIRADYESFLSARAALVLQDLRALWVGHEI